VAKGLQAQLKRQMAERDRILITRQTERERIARELHDTLIQSTQGLIYLFQGLAERISPDDRTRAQLESALVRANEVAAEGRDRIEDLRETIKISTDLPRALAALGDEAFGQEDIRFRTIVTGAAREIGPGVIDAISWIGREALANARRHSHASSIEIEIAHEDESLVVSIRDDGVGLSEETVIADVPGHWGIRGMRERAASIDAHIEFRPRDGGGTEVRLTTPGTVAYGDMTGRFRWRSFERRARSR
jgi:signal transduction histidine kinase